MGENGPVPVPDLETHLDPAIAARLKRNADGLVAAIVRGEVVAGLIHDPLGDDMAIAVRGEGAWIERPEGVK